MPRGRVLVVDDEHAVRESLEAILEEHFVVHKASSGPKALKVMKEFPIDVVVTDHNMPDGSGAELLDTVEKEHPAAIGILMTGRPDSVRVQTLVAKSIRHGADPRPLQARRSRGARRVDPQRGRHGQPRPPEAEEVGLPGPRWRETLVRAP